LKKYIKFIKIEHTLFSLPIVFAGVFLASSLERAIEPIPLATYFWILIAVFGARSAGFAMNRLIDKNSDRLNPRTKDREIPSGLISENSARIFILICCLLFIFSAGQIAPHCLYLSPIPLIFFFVYPFLKRFTVWAHLGLGIAWGIAPIGGWLAVMPTESWYNGLGPIILLSIFSIFWVAGFDIIYALLDESHDREIGVYSMPALLGTKNALRVSRIFHLAGFMSLTLLSANHLSLPFSRYFLALAGGLLVWSQIRVMESPKDPVIINFAFFKVNAVLGFVIFLMVLI